MIVCILNLQFLNRHFNAKNGECSGFINLEKGPKPGSRIEFPGYRELKMLGSMPES